MASRLYPGARDHRLIEKLAEVKPGTFKKMMGIMAHIDLRSDEWRCYRPREDEYVLGEETQEGYHKIMVEMPDGRIMEGDTCEQGSGPTDASYLVWSWIHDYYAEVHQLENFVMYGWGRVGFPDSWNNRMVRFNDDFIGPVMCGEYYGGGTDDPKLIEALLYEMYVELPGDVAIEDLHGVEWG